ncbi:catalase-related domain-containing protein [Cryobacterium sp. MLB-32]|uniref:catalase-related domain-containing protein n=1 Tax=Cryobacterium sp. MLB-32 TaxID=1529318 RepID=UPI00350FFC6C
MYREVFDDAAKARFLDTITGAVSGVTRPEVTERAIWYWTSVDAELGASLRRNLAALAEAEPVSAN